MKYTKLIRKYIALGMLLATTPCFASTLFTTNPNAKANTVPTELPLLTLEEATNMAISCDPELATYMKKIDANKENMKYGEASYSYGYWDLSIGIRSYEQQRDFIKDKITYSTKSLYHDILLQNETIHLQKESIKLAEKELKLAQIKLDHHAIDELSYTKAVANLNEAYSTLETYNHNLANLKKNFETLTKYNVDNYRLESPILYTPFEAPGHLTSNINNKITTMQRINEDRVKFMDDTKIDRLSQNGRVSVTSGAYLNMLANIDSEYTSISKAKTATFNSLMNTYTQILNLEEDIALTKQSITLLESDIEKALIQLKHGSISQFDYDKLINQYEQSQFKLLSNINKHELLIDAFEKPWSV